MVEAEVTSAGVDTFSPSWYVDLDGRCAAVMRELATASGGGGAMQLPGSVAGVRVGWYPVSGLVYAEGRLDPDGGLCPASELPARALAVQESILDVGIPLPVRSRPFRWLGASSQGWAGVRRCDATVNLAMESRAAGLGVLAGIAALARDSPGHAEVRYGPDHGVETVYLRGRGGRSAMGRWYDKALEASTGPRGTLIRGEDQRRWGKLDRRDIEELTAHGLRSSFQRRFLPLYRASKGVVVAGVNVIDSKLIEAVAAGELTPREAESLCGHLHLRVVAGPRGVMSRSTAWRRDRRALELGLVLADGVLEEVEIDVHRVLELALETDAWERRG